MSRHTVAHVRDIYLKLSETFIYGYLMSLVRYRPIVLARRTRNLDMFPFPAIYAPPCPEVGRIWGLWNELWRLMTTQAGIIPSFYDIGRRYFASIIARERPVLIHAHFGQEGVRMLPVKSQTDLPLVTTFYGYDMSMLPRRPPGFWRGHYRRLFATGDLFLVEGSHMRQGLINLGCPAEKIRIQHIGVNLERFTFSPRTLSPGEKVKILFCGRFIEKKGLIYALKAVRQVVAQFSHLEFRIIGDGPLRKQLYSFVRRTGLEPYVTWLGYQPHHVFAEELQRAHIFVQPSITPSTEDSEGGAPTTLLEAQATGIPVLATFHADIPEVVLHEQSGFLVPERDVDALSERLLYLIGHPETWSEMGRMGRLHVEQHYESRVVTRHLESIYDECLAG